MKVEIDHYDVIYECMSLENKAGIHHKTMCTNGKLKVRVLDLCYNEADGKFYYAYITEHDTALVKEYNTFVKEFKPCE